MPTISVPDVFRPSLDRIVSMSELELQELHDVLTALKVRVKPEALTESVKSLAKGQLADLPEIVQTLINLSITRFRAEVPLEEFIEGVSRSLRFGKDQEVEKRRKVLQERLNSLLAIEALVLSARAFDIQHEYEKVFRSARIITDIRPVFKLSGTEAIGAMIVHSLSISYIEDGDYKQTIFA